MPIDFDCPENFKKSHLTLWPERAPWGSPYAMVTAAIELAYDDLKDSFSLVLYDFTTLCFGLFKQYDFQHHGFFKDNMQKLNKHGYCYIVGARLINGATTHSNSTSN